MNKVKAGYTLLGYVGCGLILYAIWSISHAAAILAGGIFAVVIACLIQREAEKIAKAAKKNADRSPQ